jgi:septation ring formation regulator EzrA
MQHPEETLYLKVSLLSLTKYIYVALEAKLSDEKAARARADSSCQEKDREFSMLQVDFRQLQYKLDKVEGDHRLESEKARGLSTAHDRIREEKSLMQSDLSVQVRRRPGTIPIQLAKI